jgi:hypothetical protein
MARPSQPPDLAALGFGDEIDEVLRGANPNPARIGCPPRDVLVALSRRAKPIGDPAYHHLLECSPCYAEVRDMQRADVLAEYSRARSRWWMAVLAAAAVVAAIGIWFVSPHQEDVPTSKGGPVTTQVTLDLRPHSAARGDSAAEAPPPLLLPRGLVELTLLLPVGSEPGPYDVQLLDAEQVSLASAHGKALIRDFVTTVHASLDLGRVPTGDYGLAVRRVAEEWRVYPAVVRQE